MLFYSINSVIRKIVYQHATRTSTLHSAVPHFKGLCISKAYFLKLYCFPALLHMLFFPFACLMLSKGAQKGGFDYSTL